MQTQHHQTDKNYKTNIGGPTSTTLDDLALQKLQAWRSKCKEFLENALEILIQARGASFGNSIQNSQLKQFGMNIWNQNDMRQLLTAFGSLTPSMTEQLFSQNETERPLFQEVFLDVIHTNRIGSVLSERWNFSLSLSPQIKKLQSHQLDQGKSNHTSYFKRLCVALRSLRSLQLTLPSYNLIGRLQKIAKNQLMRTPDQEVLKDIINELKAEYEIKYDVEMLGNEFGDSTKIINRKIVSIRNAFGELSIEVFYIKQDDIIDNFKSKIKQTVEKQALVRNNPFQQLLMNALGPSQTQQAPQQNQPQILQIQQQQRPQNLVGIINDQQRFRANSDNTYNYSIGQRAVKQQQLINLRQNMNSPGPSDGLMIREDYFTTEKQKFFYQISNKHSGTSFSSGLSNKSSEFLKQGTPPFIPQVNYQPTTQGSSSILKSSLEGMGGLGNFDSHDGFQSNRPARPKIEPFKKFDNIQTSRNRNFRLSFDEGVKPLQSQRSFTSLFTPSSIKNPNSFRKASNINPGESLNQRIESNLIVEEDQNENQFDLVINPFTNRQIGGDDVAKSFEKSGFNQLNFNTSQTSLQAFESLNFNKLVSSPSPTSNHNLARNSSNQQLALQSQNSGGATGASQNSNAASATHQFFHAIPRKNSSIFKNEVQDAPSGTMGRISFGHGAHEPIKRISSCQDMMMFGGGGALSGAHSFHIDPLFQIDERKKYIGFLEESDDEEKSQSDDGMTSSSSDHPGGVAIIEEDEEEGIANFIQNIGNYQKRVDANIADEVQKGGDTGQDKKAYQLEMRRELFHLLSIREIIFEQKLAHHKQKNLARQKSTKFSKKQQL